MDLLLRDDLFTVERDAAQSLVRLTRSEVALPLDRVDAAFAPLVRLFADLERAQLCLLLDMRKAPLRIDDRYEQALNLHFNRLIGGFRRRAVLVKSAVGVLQVSRLEKNSPRSTAGEGVFRDEAEALAFLRQP